MYKYNSTVDTSAIAKKIQQQAQLGLEDVIDDLVRTSSQSAPHDEGILEKSWTKTIVDGVGTVSYAVKKKGGKDKKFGNFNYALKMHEGGYNLGEKSQAKTGGTGMSGKTYPVGAGYLGGVAKGEEETYKAHIEKMVKNI